MDSIYTSNGFDLHNQRFSVQQADHYTHPIRSNPLTVAQYNEQDFIVESILGHCSDRNRPSTLQFNVRWSGFDDSSDSRESHKALMHVYNLHDYLRANAMKTLIPWEHK